MNETKDYNFRYASTRDFYINLPSVPLNTEEVSIPHKIVCWTDSEDKIHLEYIASIDLVKKGVSCQIRKDTSYDINNRNISEDQIVEVINKFKYSVINKLTNDPFLKDFENFINLNYDESLILSIKEIIKGR